MDLKVGTTGGLEVNCKQREHFPLMISFLLVMATFLIYHCNHLVNSLMLMSTVYLTISTFILAQLLYILVLILKANCNGVSLFIDSAFGLAPFFNSKSTI